MKIKSRRSSKTVRRALSLRRECLFLRADPKPRATTKLALSAWTFLSVLSGCHSWAWGLTSQTRNPSADRVPLWQLHTDHPSPFRTHHCCKTLLPTADKICVARALFFFRAYSSYPCWDLINSSNS